MGCIAVRKTGIITLRFASTFGKIQKRHSHTAREGVDYKSNDSTLVNADRTTKYCHYMLRIHGNQSNIDLKVWLSTFKEFYSFDKNLGKLIIPCIKLPKNSRFLSLNPSRSPGSRLSLHMISSIWYLSNLINFQQGHTTGIESSKKIHFKNPQPYLFFFCSFLYWQNSLTQTYFRQHIKISLCQITFHFCNNYSSTNAFNQIFLLEYTFICGYCSTCLSKKIIRKMQ